VIIFDYNSFLVYDFEGTFITKFDLEVNVNSVMDGNLSSWLPFNDSLFIGQVSNYSGQGKHKAVFFDNRGKTIKLVPNYSVLSLPKGYSDSNKSLAFIYKHGGNTFFKEYYDDTLFIINDQYLMDPVCFFFLGKYGMPSSFRELPRQEFLKVKQNYISIKNIFETSSYIFLNCLFRNHTPAKRSEALIYPNIDGSPLESWYYPVSMLGVYQKLTKEMRFAKPLKSDNEMINDGLHNDFDGGVNFYPTKMVNDSTLAMWVDAYKLKEHVASIEFKNSMPKYQEKKRELELFVNQLDVNDNPVLILCTFK